jgi:TPR repeat protein
VLLLITGLAAGAGATEDFAAGVAAAKAGDYERARAIWLPLAEAGDPASQYNIGMMHARGEGGPPDYAEAARWFRMAAEQGQVQAQAHLGGMYARGIGVEQDYRKAADWHYEAAKQHRRESQYELGILYASGEGVKQDYEQAYFWLTLAGLQKYIPALAAKDEIRPYLHPVQIMNIEQDAQDWLQKNAPAMGEESKTL